MVHGPKGCSGVYLRNEKDGRFGGLSASEEFQNPIFESSNSEKNVVQNSDEAISKRIRLSSEFNYQEGEANSSEQTSPLGLTLKKTPSFLKLLEMKLSQARKTNHGSDHDVPRAAIDDFISQPISEKLKASNFPTSLLKIGSWERISRHEGDLIAKCYYAKRKFVWEVLEGALKSKIEIQWSDIGAIRACIRDDEPGILEIELNQPPLFFRESNPQPRKHTIWHQAADFTGGQAPICRRHSAIFPPGILDKHYEKLLQCDNRLLTLSQKPFPTQESPYFHPNLYGYSEFPFDFNGSSPEFPPRLQYPVPTFPTPVVPPHHFQNFKPTTGPPLGTMDSDSPMSVMDFRHTDERTSNYAVENQGRDVWGRGLNNVANNLARGNQIQVNPVLPYQDYRVMHYGEEIGKGNPNTEILGDIGNHLLGDSQVVCFDESTVLPGVRTMGSFLGQLEKASLNNNNSGTNHLEYECERIANDHLAMNSIEHSGINGGLVYPKPLGWLPPQDSNANMMMNLPRNKSLYPYIFSEPTEEDFATLGATQEVRHWT